MRGGHRGGREGGKYAKSVLCKVESDGCATMWHTPPPHISCIAIDPITESTHITQQQTSNAVYLSVDVSHGLRRHMIPCKEYRLAKAGAPLIHLLLPLLHLIAVPRRGRCLRLPAHPQLEEDPQRLDARGPESNIQLCSGGTSARSGSSGYSEKKV